MLGPEERKKLQDIALSIFRGRMESPQRIDSAASAPAVSALADEIVTTIRSTLAEELREMNRTVLTHYHLPVELMCLIWQHLPPHDRLTVSHISHDWREAAAAHCPQLWNSVSFTSTLHAESCVCATCSSESSASNTRCNRCRRPIPQTWSNLPLVKHSVDLSGALPLSLTIDSVATGQTDPIVLRKLTAALGTSTARIQSLEVQTDDVSVFEDGFFSEVDELPALRELSINALSDDEHEWQTVISLPALEKLKMTGRLRFVESKFNMTCPRVKELQAVFYQTRDVITLLRACPDVDDLRLQVGPERVYQASAGDTDRLQEMLKAANPTRVQVVEVHESDCEAVIPIFANPHCLQLSWGYVGDNPPPELTRILADIEKPISLSCRLAKEVIAVQVNGDNNQTRLITHRLFDSSQTAFPNNVWHCLSPRSRESVAVLTVNGGVWAKAFRECPEALAVREFVLEFALESDWNAWRENTESVPSGAFRNLDTLRVVNLGTKSLPYENDLETIRTKLFDLLNVADISFEAKPTTLKGQFEWQRGQ